MSGPGPLDLEPVFGDPGRSCAASGSAIPTGVFEGQLRFVMTLAMRKRISPSKTLVGIVESEAAQLYPRQSSRSLGSSWAASSARL